MRANPSTRTPFPRLEPKLRAIAETEGLTLEDLNRRLTKYDHRIVRQRCFQLMATHGWSGAAIARAFRCDRTTVLYWLDERCRERLQAWSRKRMQARRAA